MPVAELVESLRQKQRWSALAAADVETMVSCAVKKRYEIGDGQIREFYGHSVPSRIERTAAIPPPVLFHGTSPSAAKAIRLEGFRPMRRQFVHLSADRETARTVGERRGPNPVLLLIDTVAGSQAGVSSTSTTRKYGWRILCRPSSSAGTSMGRGESTPRRWPPTSYSYPFKSLWLMTRPILTEETVSHGRFEAGQHLDSGG